ncbi:uncharacterized protein PpBr36_09704 [Pyricularia pennisetigena]|uniref:uncharacterized protein n=1 Tax=Pyricularia pennisetigena TaxID=1578925 RepID=UPI0011524D65|nr:uncharacterized protein PpBr36_09704 [Pyricularia pennisetigena]TLS22235.1 hypothetical protein PpBr36_09704 [Pyricularia pennisetigena]
MQFFNSRNDQALYFHLGLTLGQTSRIQGHFGLSHLGLGGADHVLSATDGAPPPAGGNANPAVDGAGGDKDDLPLAGGEQVADDEVMLVAVKIAGSVSSLNETIMPCGAQPSTRFLRNFGTGSKSTIRRLDRGTAGDESKLSNASSSSAAAACCRATAALSSSASLLRRLLARRDGYSGEGTEWRCRLPLRLSLLAVAAAAAVLHPLHGRGGLDFVFGHALRWDEKVRHGCGQVQQTPGAERAHQLRDSPELVQVVGDGDKGQHEQHVALLSSAVLAQDAEHLLGAAGVCHDGAILLVQKVEKAVCRGVAVVARVWQQRKLTVQEDDCVAGLKEVLGRSGAARSGAEIVNEAHRLPLQGHRRPARRHEYHSAVSGGVLLNECRGERHMFRQTPRWRVAAEVVVLLGRCRWLCSSRFGRL